MSDTISLDPTLVLYCAMAPKAASQATPSASQTSTVPTPGAPQFVYEQEIPVNAVAIERAETSLKDWSNHIAAVADADSAEERPSACLSCAHIQEYLPEVLKIDYGLNPSNQSLWLSHPVHAMHMSSQGLTDLTKSASAALAAKQNHQPVTYPILYQDEQERNLAMRLPGLPEYWHPAIQPEYCLANARSALKSKAGTKSGIKRASPDRQQDKKLHDTSLQEKEAPLLPSIPSTPVKTAPNNVIKPQTAASQLQKEAPPGAETNASADAVLSTSMDAKTTTLGGKIEESGKMSPDKAPSATVKVEAQSTAPAELSREGTTGSIDVEMAEAKGSAEKLSSDKTSSGDVEMNDSTQALSEELSRGNDEEMKGSQTPSSQKTEMKEDQSAEGKDQPILPTNPLAQSESKERMLQPEAAKDPDTNDPGNTHVGSQDAPSQSRPAEEQPQRPIPSDYQTKSKPAAITSAADTGTTEVAKKTSKSTLDEGSQREEKTTTTSANPLVSSDTSTTRQKSDPKPGIEEQPVSVESSEISTKSKQLIAAPEDKPVTVESFSERKLQSVQEGEETTRSTDYADVKVGNKAKEIIVEAALAPQEDATKVKDETSQPAAQTIPMPTLGAGHDSFNLTADSVPSSQVKGVVATTAESSTVKVVSGVAVGGTAEGPKQENQTLLPDATYRHFHSREDNARLVRKSIFGKRPNPSAVAPAGKSPGGATSAPSKSTGGGGGSPSSTTSNDKKRRKVDRAAPKKVDDLTTFKAPLVKRVVPPTIAIYQKREQDKADRQVRLWMRHFRNSGESAPQKKEPRSWGPNPLSKGYVFGAILDEDEKGDRGTFDSGYEKMSEELLYCLDCGHQASRSHMREHMALTRHSLAVTFLNLDTTLSCEPRRLYCFHCDNHYHSPLFLQEEERLLLKKTLPLFSWSVNEKSPEIRRSFDPLRFIRLPDVGIFWNGFHATYPIDIPRHHLVAARAARLRYQLVHGPRDVLLKRFDEKYRGQQNSTTRSRHMMALLLDAISEKIRKPVGMYNLGNTCFQTSVFQCLIHCTPLQKFFLQKIGHSSSSCQIYRRQKKERDTVCLASEMDKFFLHYQSQSCGINVAKAMKDLATKAASVSTLSPSMLSDPLLMLRESGGGDGAVVERMEIGEPMVAQKDLLAATWKVKEMSHLAGYDQRDAHEFLHAFLEVLGKHAVSFRKLVAQTLSKKKANDIVAPVPNMVEDIFQGSLRSVLLCQRCSNKRIQKELFLSISLDLSKEVQRPANSDFPPPIGDSGAPGSQSPSRETRKLSVEKCLNHFTTPEELHDPVHCPLCESKTKTKKQHVVSKLPPVLCLHLKRFHGLQKMEDFVSFPACGLNMGAYLPHWCEDAGMGDSMEDYPTAPPPDVPYDLFATVNHFGNLHNGHYVSNVKIDDQWYHCNDAHVSFTTEAQVLQGNAYLLFYVRSDVDL